MHQNACVRPYRRPRLTAHPREAVASATVTGVTFGIPVKPFPAAKRRLADVLDPKARARLGQRLAERTVRAVGECGARPLILSADDAVTRWAHAFGVEVQLDEGSSLDAAADAAVRRIRAEKGIWAILHADLPIITAADLAVAVELLEAGRSVIAPSSDGGTPLVGSSSDRFAFSYGKGSFHRHMRGLAASDPAVVISRGLLLDLDTPHDLAAASAIPEGAWLTG
jgi:2-phospho-L-lactate/phosphoenolpyruvate guanylyltransferase